MTRQKQKNLGQAQDMTVTCFDCQLRVSRLTYNHGTMYKYHVYNLIDVLSGPEVTANLYCNFAYLYWEGCVICSIYLR